jgi:hypothetical protein
MPPRKAVRADERLDLPQRLAAEGFGFHGQAATLSIGEPESPGAELFPKDAVLFLEIVDDVALLLANPAGDGDDEKLEDLWKR